MSKTGPEPLSHSDGLREGGGILRSALQRATEGPLAGADDVFMRVAFLVRGIVEEHAYVNGNKRTGLAVLGATLLANGMHLLAPLPEVTRFMERVAMSEESVDTMALWLASHAEPL